MRPPQEMGQAAQPLLGNLQLTFAAGVGEGMLLPAEAVIKSRTAHPDFSERLVLRWPPPHHHPPWANRKVPRPLAWRIGRRGRILCPSPRKRTPTHIHCPSVYSPSPFLGEDVK